MAYNLEDFDSLFDLLKELPDGSPLCARIAEQFASFGLSDQAVIAFIKAGNVQGAVDCCITLNEWSKAVELAEKYHLPQIEKLLTQYAAHLIAKQEPFQVRTPSVCLWMKQRE